MPKKKEVYKPNIDKIEVLVMPPIPSSLHGIRVYLHHSSGAELTTLFTNDTYSEERAEGFKQWLIEHLKL